MISFIAWAATGLVAGAGHVFAGPDHLAAVAPLASEPRRQSWRTGLAWGIGHSGGVWLLAVLALLFRELLPIEALSTWSERLVGVVLIGIGFWGFRRLSGVRIHAHSHEHDGDRHAHIHVHTGDAAHAHPHTHAHTHSALAVGTLHGLAGTSHLLGVLPTLAIPARGDALAYVIAFGVGSIIAMTVFAGVIGALSTQLERRGVAALRGLTIASSGAAVIVGALWIWLTW